jgi:hypothetical protein
MRCYFKRERSAGSYLTWNCIVARILYMMWVDTYLLIACPRRCCCR